MPITVVIRPFKSGGKFYPAGTLVDPVGFKLYRSRLGSGNLAVVDEHNLEDVSRFLHIRHKVENAEEVLRTHMADTNKPAVSEEYLEKVTKLAEQYDIVMEDRPLEDVVTDIKAAAAQAKANEEKTE